MKPTFEERFWNNVDRREPDECWEWMRKSFVKGYGRIRRNGRKEMVHRISWELHFGPIPEGMMVCHHCDNRKCCNPAHLFLGTGSDNMQDMIQKGRGIQPNQQGENHSNSRLTKQDVIQIFKL